MDPFRRSLQRFGHWLVAGGTADIAGAVDLDFRRTARGERNHVRIDLLLPEPGGGAEWRLRITTRKQILPDAHFDRAVRSKVKRASQERGRCIYAIERESLEVVAVLSYHLDDEKGRPLLITALGTRCDEHGSPELFDLSLAVVWLLKQFAHAIAEQAGRGTFVDMDASTRPEVLDTLKLLGFRAAPRVHGFVPSGRHLRQDAVSRR